MVSQLRRIPRTLQPLFELLIPIVSWHWLYSGTPAGGLWNAGWWRVLSLLSFLFAVSLLLLLFLP
jgi:hypothetical protein